MPRNITVTFEDGATHVYENAPDDVTPDQITQRAQQDFGKSVKALDGGRSGVPPLLARPEISQEQLHQQEFQRLQQEQTEELGPVGRFLAGAGQSVYQTGRGISQLFGQMSDEEVAESRRLDEALMGTPAGIAGNVAGNVGQIVGPGLAARALSAPSLVQQALLPTTYRAAAAQGGALGAAQPIVQDESRAENTALGALFGLGGQAIPRVAGSAIRGGSALVAPLTARGQERVAANVIQRFATSPASIQAAEQSAVPGVRRSLAEATLDPGVAQLQRAASVAEPQIASALDTLRRSNNAARVEALEGIAGTVDDMAKAESGRNKAALPLLSKAMASNKGVDLSRVENIAGNILKGRSGQRSVVSAAVNDVVGKISAAKQQIADQYIAAGVPVEKLKDIKLNAATMYGIRQHIDDLMAGRVGGDAKSAVAARRELQAIKSAIDGAVTKAVPEFGGYLRAYKSGSLPINQMQLGREILDRATGNIRDPVTGALQITANRIGRTAESLDEAAKAATGFKGAKAGSILSPEQMQAVRGINADVARESFADAAGRVPGSPTAQYLAGQNVLRQILGPLGLPQGFAEAQVLERAIATPLDQLYKLTGSSQRVQQVLGELLTDPARARQVLSSLPAPDRRLIEAALAQYSTATGSAIAAQ